MTQDLFLDLQWLPQPPATFKNDLKALAESSCKGADLRFLASHCLTLMQLEKLAKTCEKLKVSDAKADLKPLESITLGIVSNSTISFFSPAIVASGLRYGFDINVVEAPYGQLMQTALTGCSAFDEVKPDFILLALDANALPLNMDDLEFGVSSDQIEKCENYISHLINGFSTRYGVSCIVQTLAHTPLNIFGSLDRLVFNTHRQMTNALNEFICTQVAASDHHLLDVASLSETVGLSKWYDAMMYNIAKVPFSQSCLPLYAEHLCRVIAAKRGKTRRAIVLDLDNTMWGGIIGDDGMSGIKIGQGDPVAEAHWNLQNYVFNLRKRGIVLTVSSKNTDEIAREPFRDHPDMKIREEHIAVFQANWEDKATNIRAISETLDLGLESFVFLDDNPMERGFVRKALPQVAVPELPADASNYVLTLSAAGYFEAIHYSTEDKMRVEDYQNNARRAELKNKAGDIDEYLNSLEMKAQFKAFDEHGLKRTVQLISKSNQFNLTTRRHGETAVRQFMASPDYVTFQVRLQDSFADNGMISVIIAKDMGTYLEIDTWIMSCRVLGRKLEQLAFEQLVKVARERGLKEIKGVYIPTQRNAIVSDHYLNLGFVMDNETDDGLREYSFKVAEYIQPEIPIVIEK
ncbi:HAD-superfamily phosphatase subfamily IIIC [Candidatus Terasakiella magnetica]|uniref:HAD-superfamily phosphatase subfamily IIIC n=1 Tax=Candidatus Terasakiella magnetica TaxID=1867952 RepID=A0A1C3RG42_9PROT|nr:HAD-IIIC family phosphatase [Candidatus Terasakiella magnetica]SCA56276.1 HAD-superfamily phosphatase subfamily IIIC [Candidatus Terasakiella magnetica]